MGLPHVAFQLVGTDGNVVFTIDRDGNITSDGGRKLGTIDDSHINLPGLGTGPLWTVERDGTVKWSLAPDAKIHFDEKNVLLLDSAKGSASVTVDDTGVVTITTPKGKDVPPWRVKDMTPAARRSVALLSLSIARRVD